MAATAVMALFLGTGCAVTRGVLDVRVKPPGNPASGDAAQITNVTDRRVFQINPRDARIPSLKNDEITDTAITSRAIARKRGGFGKAMGDILLPEGRTVTQLVEEALTRSLQEAGYRVLTKQEAASASAIPVEVDIEQFWAWFRPGFWQIAVEFETRLRMKAPVGAWKAGDEVKGFARITGQAATSDMWLEAVDKGVDDLVRNMRERLRSASASPAQR
jgi:hypothetical protein